MIKLSTLLKEYSEKTINGMVQLYKSQTQDSEDQIKANIRRFQQLTDSIAQKLASNNPLINQVIPDELKQNNKFRDITLYKDYNLFLRILKAADTKSVDIYKQAIEFYKKQNKYLEPSVIGNYVARFKQNLRQLKDNVSEKDSNTLENIPKELLKNNAYENILNWRNFQDLEHMLDAVFPLVNTGGGENDASTDADKIYEKNGLEIFKGDEEHRCIRHSQGYSWCIGRSHYQYYRYQRDKGQNRTFYFVFDRTLPKTNKYHVVVLHSLENGTYKFTNANNSPGEQPNPATSWKGLGEEFKNYDGEVLWDKIKNLEHIFKFIPPSKDEMRRLGWKGKKMPLASFAELDIEDKTDWLRINAGDRNIVTSEIVKSLPPFGDASINDLINYDREFNFDELKANIGLLKRYANYRFTRYPDKALSPLFIPYLKPDLQQLYYDKFENDNLTFEYIEKYFSEDILNNYIEKQINQLSYLPASAIKYMDEKQRQLYNIYSISFADINLITIENTEESIFAETQSAIINEMSYETFSGLESGKRKMFIDFLKKLGSKTSNIEKYGFFFMGIPKCFKYNNLLYFILPFSKNNNDEYTIINEEGTLQSKTKFNEISLYKGSKKINENDFINKQIGTNSFWVESNEFDSLKNENGQEVISLKNLKEAIQETTSTIHKLKYLAGIIK